MDPVVHFEIPMEDEERAKKFYGEIFGWKLNKMGNDYGGYVMVQTGPTDAQGMPERPAFINGGLMKRGTVKSPVLVIAVDDCDATVAKVIAGGGKLVGEIMDIPHVGRYAYVQDCEGNVIGVIKPLMPGNPQ